MKKRIISMLLVIVMVMGLVPGFTLTASAADVTADSNLAANFARQGQSYSVYVGGEQFTSDKLVIEGATGTATYTPSTSTITLNNFSYEGTGDYYNSAAIYSDSVNLNIVLEGTNTLFNTSGYDDDLNVGVGYGICVTNGDLNISGDGSLEITAKTTGIDLTGALTVSSDLNITVKTDYGIEADYVTITGGKTEIYADENGGDYGIVPYGINVYYDLILTGGELKVSAEYGYGINAYSIAISNAKFDIVAYDDALYASDTLSITNAEGCLESDGENAIHAGEDITISASTLTIVADRNGICTDDEEEAPVSITDNSQITIYAAKRGIYTSENESEITISDSQVTITVDNGEYSSDEGICTEGEESPIIIENGSEVQVITVDNGIYTDEEDSDITISDSEVTVESEYGYGIRVNDKNGDMIIKKSTVNVTAENTGLYVRKKGITISDASVVKVTSDADYAIYVNKTLEITGDKTIVVLISSAADGNGIECDDFDMTGGWLNNNGNHTFASDFELDEELLIAEERLLHIYNNVSLTMNKVLTNNGTIQNSGTLTISNKDSLIGSGTAEGSGTFQISDFVDTDIIVPENLEYSGEDQTDAALAAISLPANVTIQNAEFKYLDTVGWVLTIIPSEVKNAGTYTAVYTKGEKTLEKNFEVAKKEIEVAGAVVSDKVYDGSVAVAVSSVTFSDIISGESLVFGEDYLVQSAEFPDKNTDCENQTVTMSVELTDSAKSSNYMLTNGNGFAVDNAAKITPKTLTITADSYEVYIGSRQPKLTCTVDGLIDGDKFETEPSCTTDVNMYRIGTYTIIPDGADAGDNYSITYVNGTLTVKHYPYSSSGSTYYPAVGDSENGDVAVTPKNPEKGDTVVITPAPDAGYKVDKVIVTDRNGNPVTVIDNGDGTYSFKQPGGKVNIEVTFKEIAKDCPRDWTCPLYGYTDLDTGLWYHSGIHYCIENGLMSGVSSNEFSPDTPLTRAMLVTILWRMEGCPVVNYAMDYDDVAANQWYTEAIRWAAGENLAEGYGNSRFGTNDAITREQMVTIMFRYAKHKGYDVSVGENTNILSYDDAFDVAEWATPAMQWACGSGMIKGIADGDKMNLAPQGSATRAQAATILQRYCENVAKP